MRHVVFIVLVLLLVGCGEDTAVPTVTAVMAERPLATDTPAASPSSMLLPSATPTVPASTTPTPTPIAAPLPVLLTTLLENGGALSYSKIYPSSSFPDFIPLDNNKDVLLLTSYRNETITVTEHSTGDELFTLSEAPFVVAKDLLFQTRVDDQTATLTAYDLTTGTQLWRQILATTREVEPIAISDQAILIIIPESGNDSSNTYFYDQRTGEQLWHNHIPAKCYSTAGITSTLSAIYLACYETFLALDAANGDLIYQKQLPEDTSFYNLISGNESLYFARSAWVQNENGSLYKTVYLQSVDTQDIDHVFWERQINYERFHFDIFEGDIIYREENRIYRLNGRTGETVWETELRTYTPTNMIISGNWILLGSGNGYLHLLNGTTGVIVWEQDLWATLQSRPLFVLPIAWTESTLFLQTDFEWVDLALHGYENRALLETVTPIPSRMPTVTPTPLPILPTLEANTIPQQPEAIEDWPASILAYLNSPETTPAKLEDLLIDWLPGSPTFGVASAIMVEEGNLNGNGLPDLIVNVKIWPGWMLAFIQQSPSNYVPVWAQQSDTPQLLAIEDFDQNGLSDFAYADTVYGASNTTVTIYVVGWQHDMLQTISNPIVSTNVHVPNIQIEDIDFDGYLDIVFQGGTFGSAAAGPNRESTFVYSWGENGFELVSEEPMLPQDYFFFLVEANQLLTSGQHEAAINLYEQTMDTEDALYYYNTPHQRAFAEFQIMLAHLLLGDEPSAAVYAENDHYPDQLYSEVKQLFWHIYQETNDWTEAAEAARKRVRMADFQQAQLIPWVGYANTPLTLNDIVPCDECLQGPIGSDFGP